MGVSYLLTDTELRHPAVCQEMPDRAVRRIYAASRLRRLSTYLRNHFNFSCALRNRSRRRAYVSGLDSGFEVEDQISDPLNLKCFVDLSSQPC